jgi:hypothetical protein
MAGALVIVFVLVIAIPVAVMLSGMVMAAILGWCLKADGEDNAVNEELIELNA